MSNTTITAPVSADLRHDFIFLLEDGTAYDLSAKTASVVLTPPRGGTAVTLTLGSGLVSPAATNRVAVRVESSTVAGWAQGLWSGYVKVVQGADDDILHTFYVDVCAFGLPVHGETTVYVGESIVTLGSRGPGGVSAKQAVINAGDLAANATDQDFADWLREDADAAAAAATAAAAAATTAAASATSAATSATTAAAAANAATATAGTSTTAANAAAAAATAAASAATAATTAATAATTAATTATTAANTATSSANTAATSANSAATSATSAASSATTATSAANTATTAANTATTAANSAATAATAAAAAATAAATAATLGIPKIPESYGAVGDGVTRDLTALRDTITAAGVNGVIRLTPGKTYLIDGALNPLAGQTFLGHGSKIKVRNEVTSATSTAISAGSSPTSITVANGALFAVGQDVTVFNGSSYDTTVHRILSIAGNVLSVGTNFAVAFPSGGTVVTAVSPFYTAASRVKVEGLEIDGNKSNNTSLAKWEIHQALALNGNYSVARDNYVHDVQSEGVYMGGDGSIADNNIVVSCGGNGIHMSGCKGFKARGNFVKDVNLAGTGPGHADGCIIFSNTTGDSVITGNYCENGIAGIASIDTSDNSSVVVTGNIIKSCTSYGLEGLFPSTTGGGKVVISGNFFYSSVKVLLSYTGSFDWTYGPANWIVSDNYFEDTLIETKQLARGQITGNIMVIASTTLIPITIQTGKDIEVADNVITGGSNGIYVDSSANNKGINVHDNILTNQYNAGVRIETGSGLPVSVRDNTIRVESTFTTAASYSGIIAANGVFVTGNSLDIQLASAGTGFGIQCPNGAAGVNGAIVTNNVVRSTNLAASIKAYGGSMNNWAVANYIQQAVSNGGGGSNTFSGNYTIN